MYIKNANRANYTQNILKALSKKRWIYRILSGLFLLAFGFACIVAGKNINSLGVSWTLREWADSLTKNKFSFVTNYFSSLNVDKESVQLDLKFENYQKISYQRYLAKQVSAKYSVHPLNMGYVPGVLRIEDGERIKTKVRLKGLFGTHYDHYNQWSFKFKLKGGKKFHGMSKFALQHPRTRSFLNGWLFPKLLKEHGLIAIRYRFLDFAINGEHIGVYAMEENMSKELIENNQRREGPIFNFNTDIMLSLIHI